MSPNLLVLFLTNVKKHIVKSLTMFARVLLSLLGDGRQSLDEYGFEGLRRKKEDQCRRRGILRFILTDRSGTLSLQ